jgi:hypothetical protein
MYTEEILENAIRIAQTSGALLESNEIDVHNSCDLVDVTIELAEIFERDHAQAAIDEGDYIGKIDEFACAELKARFPFGLPR